MKCPVNALKAHSVLSKTDSCESGNVLIVWLSYHSSLEIKCGTNIIPHTLNPPNSVAKRKYNIKNIFAEAIMPF